MDEAKLKEIRTYEEEAGRIVEAARQEYQSILRQAQEESHILLEEGKKKGKEEARAILENARTEGQKEADSILAGLGAELSGIDAKARPNMEKAVQSVIQFIGK